MALSFLEYASQGRSSPGWVCPYWLAMNDAPWSVDTAIAELPSQRSAWYALSALSKVMSVSPPLTGSPVGFTGAPHDAPPFVDVHTGLPPPLMLPRLCGAVTNRRPVESMPRLGSPSPADCGICTGATNPVPAVPPPPAANA